MKIATASTRRAIDRWKERAKIQVTRFHSRGAESVAQIIVSPSRSRILLVLPLVLALSLNFAAVELSVLIVVGFFVTKLRFYRLVNSVMKFVPFH